MEVQQEPPSKRRDTTKTVACTECRVRKTKCNRELPCESCIKRGRPQDCTPELRRYPTSVASLQGVINSLQDRVVHLESRLAALESAVGHSTSPHVSISDSRNSTGFVVPQETLGGFGASESFVTSLACHTNSTDSTKGYDRASDAPGSANASELSSFVSGKAVLKDFNILEAAKRRAAAESMPRFASSASSYPSIRDAKGVPPNSWRNSVLLALHASLPSLDVMRARVELFQDYCSWSKPAINCAQLKAELDELENLLQQGLFLQVDPAWIALLFQVLAQGTMQAYVCEDGPGNHLYDFAYSMAEASEGAMAAASWADKPSIRIVQALLLRASWLQYIDPDSGLLLQGSKQQEIILNAALAHAQALGLNKLGDDPAIMPEPDLAFPPHPCEFRRQMALRVWLNIKECFVLAGIKVDWSTSDSPDFNICRDVDLRFIQASPQETVVDWETAFRTFEVATSKDLAIRIDTRGKSRAELLAIEDQARKNFEAASALFQSLPSTGMPAFWKDHACLLTGLQIFEWGIRLRLRRNALNAPEAESISEEVHRGAIDAAVDLARVCTSPAAIRLVKTISAVVLYMLNAAVVISVAIRTGAYQHAQAELSDLLMKVVDTLANHGRMSLNTAIATNAQKAIDALFRLIRHLAQPCDGSAMQPGSLEFPIVLRRLAELSHSPDALSVLLDDPAWQQAGRLQLESTTSLQSLALLEGMDFFQWPDVMGESWNSSSTLSYSQ